VVLLGKPPDWLDKAAESCRTPSLRVAKIYTFDALESLNPARIAHIIWDMGSAVLTRNARRINMKAIKITTENAAAIEAALAAANGRATEHTYTDFDEIAYLAKEAEKSLHRLLGAERHFKGAQYLSVSGAEVPKSYKYRRNATAVKIERKGAGWYLIAAWGVLVDYRGGRRDTLDLTSQQDQRAVERLRSGYSVM
jgi:hypothetical protein